MSKEQALFQHLVQSYLYGKPIQRKISEKTFAVLVSKGYTTPEAIISAGYDNLVEAMKEGGYKRIDEITSRRLIELSEKLRREYGSMTSLLARSDLDKELQTFKGIGPVTSQIFIKGLPNVKT
jgi:endonuclease III